MCFDASWASFSEWENQLQCEINGSVKCWQNSLAEKMADLEISMPAKTASFTASSVRCESIAAEKAATSRCFQQMKILLLMNLDNLIILVKLVI